MRQVCDGSGDNVSAPRVFDGHSYAQRDTQVTNLPRLGQASDLRDFQVDHIHRLVAVPAHDRLQIIDHFVEDERAICMAKMYFVGIVYRYKIFLF